MSCEYKRQQIYFDKAHMLPIHDESTKLIQEQNKMSLLDEHQII
jgi:hypothetical protein